MRKMTLDDVRALVKKGEKVTLEDLDPFINEPILTGLYRPIYLIDGGYSLAVLILDDSVSLDFSKKNFYSIDLKKDDLESYLSYVEGKDQRVIQDTQRRCCHHSWRCRSFSDGKLEARFFNVSRDLTDNQGLLYSIKLLIKVVSLYFKINNVSKLLQSKAISLLLLTE